MRERRELTRHPEDAGLPDAARKDVQPIDVAVDVDAAALVGPGISERYGNALTATDIDPASFRFTSTRKGQC